MSVTVAAIIVNDSAANSPSYDTGAANKANDDHDSTSRGPADDAHNQSSINGQPVEVSTSRHRETINGISETTTGPSPALTSTTPAPPVAESVSIWNDNDSTGGVHKADTAEPEASSSSTSATESSRPADKRKRGKHNNVNSSSDAGAALCDSSERGTVLKFGSNTEETLRRVALGPRAANAMLHTPSTNWSFTKLFGDGEFIAAGQVCVRPGCEKPLKNVMDNTYVFFVMEGVVEFKIHKSTYTLPPGGTCMVPRGNNYSLKNISNREARVFFCQARKVPMIENEEPARPSFFSVQHDGPPTSKASILAMWFLQRLLAYIWRLRDRGLIWSKRILVQYERFATKRRLCLLCFVLGLMVRRLPFVGSPPLINIQFVRVV